MPRTFSRGVKITAEFLNRMMQYLSVDEGDIHVRQMRFLFCPEKELIEQDLQEFFEFFLPGKLSSLERDIEGLVGGGIIPGVMLTRITEIKVERNRLRTLIQRLSTPIIEEIV